MPLIKQSSCKHSITPLSTTFLNIWTLKSEKILIKPSHSLQKGLLLGKPLHLDSRVATHGESVLDLREQVDLIGMAGLLENLLGPVALLVREDGIGFGGRDGQRPRDGGELILLNE
jgi:hypothetical protein